MITTQQVADDDVAVQCEGIDCPDVAVYWVLTKCGCVDLYCVECTSLFIERLKSVLPAVVRCSQQPDFSVSCNKITDFLVSVQRL